MYVFLCFFISYLNPGESVAMSNRNELQHACLDLHTEVFICVRVPVYICIFHVSCTHCMYIGDENCSRAPHQGPCSFIHIVRVQALGDRVDQLCSGTRPMGLCD